MILLIIGSQLIASVCSGQRLTFATYPRSNTSDITIHPDYDIVTTDDILYSITDGIVKKLLYTITISLVGSESDVSVFNLNFSKSNHTNSLCVLASLLWTRGSIAHNVGMA